MLEAPLRERVARLDRAAALRGRAAHDAPARRAARGGCPDRGASAARGRRTGVLLAADLDPRHVVAFAVVRGALVAKRRLPRAGEPGLELAPSRARSSARSTPARRSSRAPQGPWLPGGALRRGAAARARFAGRAPGVVADRRARRPTRWRSGASPARAAACRCASRCRPGATRAPTSSRRVARAAAARRARRDPRGSLTAWRAASGSVSSGWRLSGGACCASGSTRGPSCFPRRGLPRRARRAGRPRAGPRALLHGHRRGRGRARRRGQAAARVLRAGGPARPGGGRARRGSSRASAGCS